MLFEEIQLELDVDKAAREIANRIERKLLDESFQLSEYESKQLALRQTYQAHAVTAH